MKEFSIHVNGENKKVTVHEDTPLLWVLRDHLRLTGTKFGCGIAHCGACTVHIDGDAMRSCIYPINALGDSKVTTIEGLSPKNDHPLQEAWVEHDVPQCGYCQSGQIMTAAAFLKENKNPSEEDITGAMSQNICRCAAYLRIKEAVKTASKS